MRKFMTTTAIAALMMTGSTVMGGTVRQVTDLGRHLVDALAGFGRNLRGVAQRTRHRCYGKARQIGDCAQGRLAAFQPGVAGGGFGSVSQ